MGSSLALRITGLVGLLGPLLLAAPVQAAWEFNEGEDAFTDDPVITATVQTANRDQLTVQCDATNSIVFTYDSQRPLRTEEVHVRYRVDKEPPVESGLTWENHNGRARTSLATKKSLFGEGGQDDEFLTMLQGLIRGGKFVIEAGGELTTFPLRGSENALLAVLSGCGIEVER